MTDKDKMKLSSLLEIFLKEPGMEGMYMVDTWCKYEAEMRRLFVGLKEELDSNRWIPVSRQLPENGNPVIVTARRNDGARGYFIYKACYNAPQTHTTEDYGWDSEYIDSEYDEENDCFWVPECWFEDNAIEDNGNYMLDDEFDILAWQPLPEPYKAEIDCSKCIKGEDVNGAIKCKVTNEVLGSGKIITCLMYEEVSE